MYDFRICITHNHFEFNNRITQGRKSCRGFRYTIVIIVLERGITHAFQSTCEERMESKK